MFRYQLSDHLDAYGKLGVTYLELDKQSTFRFGERLSDSDTKLVSAVGLDYALSERWSVRGEYQFIDGIGSDAL
ncbi:outer membrane beta-barrel protein [Shewanella atlantica]|uniref:outer membrane beta-barrel protein n=1 Tax=Shewanella atlantica TaxID=271099 RepID=UPI0016397CEC|nr:outer membrane beta-barrel protein [Shewanella atlantica]